MFVFGHFETYLCLRHLLLNYVWLNWSIYCLLGNISRAQLMIFMEKWSKVFNLYFLMLKFKRNFSYFGRLSTAFGHSNNQFGHTEWTPPSTDHRKKSLNHPFVPGEIDALKTHTCFSNSVWWTNTIKLKIFLISRRRKLTRICMPNLSAHYKIIPIEIGPFVNSSDGINMGPLATT